MATCDGPESGPDGASVEDGRPHLSRNSISAHTMADLKLITERAAWLLSEKAQPIRVRSTPALCTARPSCSAETCPQKCTKEQAGGAITAADDDVFSSFTSMPALSYGSELQAAGQSTGVLSGRPPSSERLRPPSRRFMEVLGGSNGPAMSEAAEQRSQGDGSTRRSPFADFARQSLADTSGHARRTTSNVTIISHPDSMLEDAGLLGINPEMRLDGPSRQKSSVLFENLLAPPHSASHFSNVFALRELLGGPPALMDGPSSTMDPFVGRPFVGDGVPGSRQSSSTHLRPERSSRSAREPLLSSSGYKELSKTDLHGQPPVVQEEKKKVSSEDAKPFSLPRPIAPTTQKELSLGSDTNPQQGKLLSATSSAQDVGSPKSLSNESRSPLASPERTTPDGTRRWARDLQESSVTVVSEPRSLLAPAARVSASGVVDPRSGPIAESSTGPELGSPTEGNAVTGSPPSAARNTIQPPPRPAWIDPDVHDTFGAHAFSPPIGAGLLQRNSGPQLLSRSASANWGASLRRHSIGDAPEKGLSRQSSVSMLGRVDSLLSECGQPSSLLVLDSQGSLPMIGSGEGSTRGASSSILGRTARGTGWNEGQPRGAAEKMRARRALAHATLLKSLADAEGAASGYISQAKRVLSAALTTGSGATSQQPWFSSLKPQPWQTTGAGGYAGGMAPPGPSLVSSPYSTKSSSDVAVLSPRPNGTSCQAGMVCSRSSSDDLYRRHQSVGLLDSDDENEEENYLLSQRSSSLPHALGPKERFYQLREQEAVAQQGTESPSLKVGGKKKEQSFTAAIGPKETKRQQDDRLSAPDAGAILPLLSYLSSLDSRDPGLLPALATLGLLVSNAPNRGVVVGCHGPERLLELLKREDLPLGVQEAIVGLLWDLDLMHTSQTFRYSMLDVIAIGKVLDKTASPTAALQIVQLLRSAFYNSPQRPEIDIGLIQVLLTSAVGILFDGRTLLPDAGQFSLGTLLAGIFQEVPGLESTLHDTLTRMLLALKDAAFDSPRKQALLTVLSSMASAPQVWSMLDKMEAVRQLLEFGAACGDARLRARALSLVKVLNRVGV